MRRGGVLACLLCLPFAAPAPAVANSLSLEIWPNRDPAETVYCAITLSHGRFSAIEVKGPGMPPARPLQWYSTEPEIAALNAALQSLISGDLPPEVVQFSRTPEPPFISATWVANVDDRVASGLYLHPGLTLPAALSQAIGQLLPGGLCHASLHL